MKKYLALFLAAITALSLSACSVMPPIQNKPSAEASASGQASSAASKIAESVLVDESSIKITALDLNLKDALWGPELKLLIENNGEKDVTAVVKYAVINDIMVENMLSCDVQAGKKANDEITFLAESLEVSGITTIKDIELVFEIYDTETLETLFVSKPASISASSDSAFVQKVDDSGAVAVDENGVKIVIKQLDSKNSITGIDVYVYVENNTDDPIAVQTMDESVNGYMITPYFYCNVLPGKKAFSAISFFEEYLKDNNITEIKELELKFEINNPDSWDTIFESEAISVTF